MRAPAAEQLLAVWERGTARHPIDRGLVLLAVARPGEPLEALADVPVGARDNALLALRAALFGRRLPSFVDCPACGTRLELTLDAGDLRTEPPPAVVDANGVRVRPPTSRDLAAAVREPDLESAELCLVRRCLIDRPEDDADTISAANIAMIQAALAAADAAADIELDLTCVECAHAWHGAFDIVDYLWREIDERARRLLQEVNLLARAYGWTEREVLTLSERRRRIYVEMVAP